MSSEDFTFVPHNQASQAELVQALLPSVSITATETDIRHEETLSAATKRVIRNQKTGSSGLSRHLHKPDQRDLRLLQQARKSTANNKDKMTEIRSARPGKPPTLQEMYNSWRALEEQVDGIHRLPMFIRAERRACHRCRVLKRKCACFDYSKLEKGYQAKDLALKQAFLRQCPFPDETETLLKPISLNERAATLNVLTPSTLGLNTFGLDGDDAMLSAVQWLPPKRTCQNTRGREIDEQGRLINDMATDEDAATDGSATQQVAVPKLMKLEIRKVLIAQERIRNNVRRWRCQFGSSGMPGGHVCMREDDHLNTIRRHYGREHGKHRYYMKPKMRMRCGHCGLTVESGMPNRCPSCNGARDVWMQEVYALIEVPVPLSTGSLEDGTANAFEYQQSGSKNAGDAQGHASNEISTAINISDATPSIPSAIGISSTPLTPVTPLTPITPSFASGDAFLADASALFPYGPLDITDWQQQQQQQQHPVFVNGLSHGQLLCDEEILGTGVSCGINAGLNLGLQGALALGARSPYTADGIEDMGWSICSGNIYRGEEEQTQRAL